MTNENAKPLDGITRFEPTIVEDGDGDPVGEMVKAYLGDWIKFSDARQSLSESVDSWQPMATVPKDGREVLLQVELRAGMPGRSLVGHYMPGGHCIEDHPEIDEGWYFWNGLMFDKAAKPVAWMPLPGASK